ncbi:sigma-70 family RNA polymerase sigma factor [Flagellimonas sp.]|uniref:sigma-70 family RNA polymerase sigma factor n=1 Tax=Flagellimonas sp. TaxID=2058762 RepID=UPI003B5AD529
MQGQIEQLYRPLFLYVKKRVNSQEDAEDITQDVFYKLSKSKTDAVDNVKSWVYTIAKNTITDYYRKKRLATNDLEDTVPAEEYNEENAAEELSKCVTVFVQELPEEYRSILTLSELEEMSQKEIAEKLDMNYVTVRSKIQRGRKKLKELFSKCCSIKQGGKGSILEYHQNSTCDEDSGCSGS